MLLAALGLLAACSALDDIPPRPEEGGGEEMDGGVLILCEGNFNAGNASLSYYNPHTRQVTNGAFRRVNDRKLGDTGQSILYSNGLLYIAVENSGIVWQMDAASLRVKGQITALSGTQIINPRYVYKVSDEKAYVTDLYAHYINIFNPRTMQYLGAIPVDEVASKGYCSTEQMVGWGDEVFVTCWSYSNKILVLDSKEDCLKETIALSSPQPKSIQVDRNGKVWVITDGGAETTPHLYRLDASTHKVEMDQAFSENESNVQLALNGAADTLYILCNDIYRMPVTASSVPATPFISAPKDADGKRHKVYGLGVEPKTGEIYMADAVDYAQSGVVFRYSPTGSLIHQFRVGIIPSHFAFLPHKVDTIPDPKPDPEIPLEDYLVDSIYEYMPAPGHQVNGYTVVGDFIRSGASMQEACDSVMAHFRKTYMVSLGAQGGYLIAGWKEPVENSRGDYDFGIKGNPYSYQSEPGIVWVMRDENGNGEPDDTWYELAGSEYGTDNETLNYAITYYKPTAPQSNIRWTDNQGGEGIVPYMATWNPHDSYWQDWVPTEKTAEGECHTFYGSRLKDTHTYVDGYSLMPPFPWGYADNDGSDYFRNQSFCATFAMANFKISNAVDCYGNPVDLPNIRWVKVQTGQTGWAPNLGEISTEVYGIWRLRK